MHRLALLLLLLLLPSTLWAQDCYTPPAEEATVSTEIATLQQLCSQLSASPVAAPELAEQLGKIDASGKSAIYISPRDAHFQKAIVSRDTATDAAIYLELVLTEATTLTTAALQEQYGEPSMPPRVGFRDPVRLVYSVDLDASNPFRCSIIAATQGDKVVSVSIRRDPR